MESALSQLGKPSEGLGWDGVLLAFAIVAVVVGLDFLLGHSLRRLARYVWKRIAEEFSKANKR